VTSMVEVRVWTVLLRVRKVFKGAPQIGQNLGAGSIRMWVLSVKLVTLTSLSFFIGPQLHIRPQKTLHLTSKNYVCTTCLPFSPTTYRSIFFILIPYSSHSRVTCLEFFVCVCICVCL